MIIKRKSLIVAVLSSIVVSLVLVLTLVGYAAYTELKGREFRRLYQIQIKEYKPPRSALK